LKKAYDKLVPAFQDEVDETIKTLMNGCPYFKHLRVKNMRGHKSILEASSIKAISITFQYNNPDYM